MLNDFINFLPSCLLLIFCLIALLLATGLKYSIKKTLLIVIPFTLILIYINFLIFKSKSMAYFDNLSILSIFAPEFILTAFIGKRKGISLFVAIIDAYVAFYIVVLFRNISIIYYPFEYAEYVIYLCFIPLLFLYLYKFYNNFHNEVEKLAPNFLALLGVYSLFILFEFYFYRYLTQTTNQYILRLEIFGVAIISVYIISIGFFSLLINKYKNTFIKAHEKDKLDKQLEMIVDQYKIREKKDQELTILRHDLKHVLITAVTLIKQEKYQDAQSFLEDNVKTIELNKVIKYCSDPIINAIICYYKNLCIENKISLQIKISNIESVLKINSSEIAILLSNCFDNAINASKKLKNNRLIEFKFINNNGKLVLQIKNKYNGNIEFDKDNLPTNHKVNHGIGTQSIVTFCKKHKLTLNYKTTEDYFTLSIIF